ncbi:hypothetical protein CFP56_002838 [Quercus suber]|uniref:Uncharacterized protein n=1 Tax=Quercus suber TaxID=58331 RepID=A0AAW0IKI9_QUESU
MAEDLIDSLENMKLTAKEEKTIAISKEGRFPEIETNSDVKHSFSFATTSLMGGLLVEVEDTQTIAISIAFQAELALKSLCNLGSTIF